MEKSKPMFVEVPESLHRAVKIRAAQDGTSIKALIAEGMRRVTAPRKDDGAVRPRAGAELVTTKTI